MDLREAGRWKRRLLRAGQAGMLAAAYFAAAKASLLLAIPPGYATAIWPPAGIALAALLIRGDRLWPGIWLGAALANVSVSCSPFAALVIAGGNTLEALCGAALVRRFIADAPPFFDRARSVVLFVAVAAVCSTVAATIGTGALLLEGAVASENLADNWGTWWHGDATGIIIVTPLLLTWILRHRIAWSRARALELAGLVASLLAVATLVFGQDHAPLAPFPLTFLILPFIVWTAFRFSRREVTSAIAVVCAVASIGLLQVVNDPRIKLSDALHAILVAELVDNEGWSLLIDLADELGHGTIAQRFAAAQAAEDRHLQTVRSWITSAVTGDLTMALDEERPASFQRAS